MAVSPCRNPSVLLEYCRELSLEQWYVSYPCERRLTYPMYRVEYCCKWTLITNVWHEMARINTWCYFIPAHEKRRLCVSQLIWIFIEAQCWLAGVGKYFADVRKSIESPTRKSLGWLNAVLVQSSIAVSSQYIYAQQSVVLISASTFDDLSLSGGSFYLYLLIYPIQLHYICCIPHLEAGIHMILVGAMKIEPHLYNSTSISVT